jgi:soluble lytic murein transglycosylase-like protein
MKFFVTVLSVPAVFICGAIVLASYGVYEGATRLVNPPPPKPLRALLPSPPSFQLNDVVCVIARKHGVAQSFVKSIIAAESHFDQSVISPRGAIGLMQLMPDTAQEYGVDPTIAEQNVDGGTRYLRWLLVRYRKSKNSLQRAIAAYNAGPGNVDRYRGIPPFRETRNYVKRVMAYYKQFEGRRYKGSWAWASFRSDTAD